MSRYRKKEPSVHAIQVKDIINAEFPHWLREACLRGHIARGTDFFLIKRPSGWAKVDSTDWIVDRSSDDEWLNYYPHCMFVQTYEPVV